MLTKIEIDEELNGIWHCVDYSSQMRDPVSAIAACDEYLAVMERHGIESGYQGPITLEVVTARLQALEAEVGDKLKGKAFHTFEDDDGPRHRGLICKQGMILGPTSTGGYTVQYYSWLTGAPKGTAIVHVDQMKDWQLYADDEAARAWYEAHPEIEDMG